MIGIKIKLKRPKNCRFKKRLKNSTVSKMDDCTGGFTGQRIAAAEMKLTLGQRIGRVRMKLLVPEVPGVLTLLRMEREGQICMISHPLQVGLGQ
jgi:hypothetical protein